MNAISPFLVVDRSPDQVVNWTIRELADACLQVLRTFDLQAARLGHADYPCPHHGSQACDCQMVVLLVYQGDQGPVSLVIRGCNGRTWFYLVDNPQQRADAHLNAAIQQALHSGK